jgi:hypothetical protein
VTIIISGEFGMSDGREVLGFFRKASFVRDSRETFPVVSKRLMDPKLPPLN